MLGVRLVAFFVLHNPGGPLELREEGVPFDHGMHHVR